MEGEGVAAASIPHTIPKEAELERREETWPFLPWFVPTVYANY